MKTEERERIKALIEFYCVPHYLKYRVDSYTFKELFERLGGTYIEHQEFKDLMQECGFNHIKQKKNSDCLYYRLKVKELAEVPSHFRGRGYQQWRYKDG